MDRIEKLREILQNEELAKEVIADSVEETLKNFEEKGVDLTEDELRELVEMFSTNPTGEVSEKDLDSVAGGRLFYMFGPPIDIVKPVQDWLKKIRPYFGRNW